ncbi:DUF6005 family protein [Paenibacillus aurantiacus]|uniref:DUF6005 family protein n=1 Tax=Paenibacillus aurantiacus TaxID=1936118 RepID=A0ABV5KRL0_9BACL
MTKPGQIHCMLDCYAAIIERAGYDSRPLYSGVWEAGYDVGEHGIAYFGDEVDPKNWPERVNRLYNATIVYWCDYQAERSVNYDLLLRNLNAGRRNGAYLLTVDLYDFPHAPQFRSRHLPHIVIFEVGADGAWQIRDPYFSWEGSIARDTLEAGFLSGVWFDTAGMHDAIPAAAAELMRQDIHLGTNPLIVDIERLVREALRRNDGYAPATLFESIQQAGVITKRFGGYLRVFGYLCDNEEALDSMAADVAALINAWEGFMFAIARLGLLKRAVDLPAISAKLARMRDMEAGIRERLLQAFSSWQFSARLESNTRG